MPTEQAAGYLAKLDAHQAAHGRLLGAMRHKPHLFLAWLADWCDCRRSSMRSATSSGRTCWCSAPASSTRTRRPVLRVLAPGRHYWGLSSNDVVTAWVALTDSTTENGAMRVVPGTHLVALPHVDTFAENNLLTRGQEVAADLGGRPWVELTLKAGEMSLHHVGLIHGSEPNRSDGRRIGYAIRYIAPSVRQTLAAADGATLVRGQDRYGHFEPEPAPAFDMAPEALAYHRFAIERTNRVLMAGTAKNIADKR